MNQEQKMLNDVDQVVGLMMTAMDLMMMVNLDSEIHFSRKDEQKIMVEMVPKSGVSPLINKLIPKKPFIIESIKDVLFTDAVTKVETGDKITLKFLSKGFLMNRGVLTLSGGNTQASVTLYGYPTALPILRGEPPKYPSDTHIQDSILKITEQTRQETAEADSR